MSDAVSVARSGMRVIWRAVRPERGKLSVAAGCGLVAWSGLTASWVFTDGMGPPKPPLYDVVWPLGLIAGAHRKPRPQGWQADARLL
jgi:hypothetical protein